MQQGSVGALVLAAAAGDQQAWEALVTRFAGLVWSVARGYRLGPADAADVSQTTWLRLVEHLHRLQEPEHVGSWIATTARNECLRVLRRSGRELVVDEIADRHESANPEPTPESVVLASERKQLLWKALHRLPPRCRALLQVVAVSPELSYEEISAALDMPVGSIGPTRARCLAHLRRELAAEGALP